MPDIWMNHLSVQPWTKPKEWAAFFKDVEGALGAKLTHLDTSDPVKRHVLSLDEAGDYVCAFGAVEDSRWVFGKFDTIDVQISIQHYRRIGHWPNSLLWHIPSTDLPVEQKRDTFDALFDVGNSFTGAFYAFCDDAEIVKSRKKPRGAIDIRSELVGVFWLTYFGPAYADYFGIEKFSKFPKFQFDEKGGVIVNLGQNPSTVSEELRHEMESALGEKSFFNPNVLVGKLPGQFALTFEQLSDFRRR